jgi:glycine/D-amino acid oxidase-like deaminating enzyme
MEVDFLLIGQGLAGSVLSYRLIQNGFDVHLIDDGDANSSSRIAAGLYNPVTGRNMVKTWQADVIFKEIEPFYQEMEVLLDKKFVHATGIYRPFISYEEQNEWISKSADPQYNDFLNQVNSGPGYQGLRDPFGGLLLKSSGYIDTLELINSFGSWLNEKGLLSRTVFSEELLTLNAEGHWQFKDITARKIIFTNGVQAGNSSFFNWIPFRPVKGEILTVRQNFSSVEIMNRGVFRIDLGNNGVGKVGATYDNKEINLSPTEAGKKEIIDKLGQLMEPEVIEVLNHQVGIRPAINDRRPVLGKHPKRKSVYLFGGLGAKGVSLAPYFSKQMLKLLVYDEEPQKEVNINRFFKYI